MPDAQTPALRHVFVYGTLRRGDANDINRLKPAPAYVGTGTTNGTMYHFGRYPGVLLGGHGVIKGEVYAVTAELERILDEIEEIYPQQTDEYFKRDIVVDIDGKPMQCFVYEINPEYVKEKALIEGGDWQSQPMPKA